MFIKKITFYTLCLVPYVFLAGCSTRPGGQNWGMEYTQPATIGMPAEMAPGFYNLEYGDMDWQELETQSPAFTENIKNVSVLLPLSGPHAGLGTGIKHAIEIAYIQKQPSNIIVSFKDLSGNTAAKPAF